MVHGINSKREFVRLIVKKYEQNFTQIIEIVKWFNIRYQTRFYRIQIN